MGSSCARRNRGLPTAVGETIRRRLGKFPGMSAAVPAGPRLRAIGGSGNVLRIAADCRSKSACLAAVPGNAPCTASWSPISRRAARWQIHRNAWATTGRSWRPRIRSVWSWTSNGSGTGSTRAQGRPTGSPSSFARPRASPVPTQAEDGEEEAAAGDTAGADDAEGGRQLRQRPPSSATGSALPSSARRRGFAAPSA